MGKKKKKIILVVNMCRGIRQLLVNTRFLLKFVNSAFAFYIARESYDCEFREEKKNEHGRKVKQDEEKNSFGTAEHCKH